MRSVAPVSLHTANYHQVVTIGEWGNVIMKGMHEPVNKSRMTKTTSVLVLSVRLSYACAKEVGATPGGAVAQDPGQ